MTRKAAPEEPTFSLMYDIKLRRPGCALLQSMGGDVPMFGVLFPAETWLLSKTPDMRVYRLKLSQLPQAIEASCKAVGVKYFPRSPEELRTIVGGGRVGDDAEATRPARRAKATSRARR